MKLKNEQQQSWLSLAFVWAGAMISVPGLIIGGMAPLQAIKFQLLVVFIHTTATIMSALIATYLSYGQFFNARHQLVARTTNIKDNN